MNGLYLEDITRNGLLEEHFYNAFDKKDYERAAFCMIPLLDIELSNGEIKSFSGNSEGGYNKFLDILNNPKDYKEIISELTKIAVRISFNNKIQNMYYKHTKFVKAFSNEFSNLKL